MSFLEEVDLDKMLLRVCWSWWAPLIDWRKGEIREEVIFLHELIRYHQRGVTKFDIGLHRKVMIEHDHYHLHRQGTGGSDQYGSDFAFTLRVLGSEPWIKTAIFQVKASAKQKVTIDVAQMRAAVKEPLLAARSFSMAIDAERSLLRVKSTIELLNSLKKPVQQTFSADITAWHPSSTWVVQWLQCHHAPPSLVDRNMESVETFLDRYVVRTPDQEPLFPGPPEPVAPRGDLPIPISWWLIATIRLD